ncbi:MAG TPA: SAM-dependent chlorinase/fluorinase [Mycobacteriales bacterium]|nr:SAM-dependent chlorinase/fluorinase [Mycobacteriales bacterium]
MPKPSKPSRYDWLTFTSDYGLDDVFVGVCKGVIAQLAPHVHIIDVTHQINAQDVEQGAASLAAAMPYLPVGVHLALVDPMRGGSSRGVVVETGDGSLLVGPDNGLLSLAWGERGGVKSAHELVNPALWRESVHRTFRGRDVFAPVAAHLAAGTSIGDVGPQLKTDSLTVLPQRGVEVDDDHVHAEVSLVDHFGNVSLNVDRAALEAAGMRFGDVVEVRCSGRTLEVPFTATYGDVARGRLTLCEDSFRAVMLAVNAGHASHELRVSRGEPIVIARLPQTA